VLRPPEFPHTLWAKKARANDPDPAAFHPLICHLLDVGAVAEQMWLHCLPPSGRNWFARQLGLEEEQAARWAIVLAALHDWGKAAPAFQAREQFVSYPPHGLISTHLLKTALQVSPFTMPPEIARRLATVVGGHHGIFPHAADFNAAIFNERKHVGGSVWKAHQQWLLEAVSHLLQIAGTPPPTQLSNPGAVWLAGFISVVDWIGSNQDFFPYAAPGGQVPANFSPDVYLVQARQQAARALEELGWSAWPDSPTPRAFGDLFPGIAPNAMQQEIISLAPKLDQPSLVIIEAPMGMGKTEAALFLADQAGVSLRMRGHYLALPTQATSNQMFSRDTAFLQHRYPEKVVNTQLLHGHAVLSSDFKALQEDERRYLQAIDIPDDHNQGFDGAEPGVIAAEWFTHRKRGLLAPFGVGTIDQALLSVLQTKHFFVRLFGLAAKTIVLDEVHAYDTYMSVLLERLLRWLSRLGCSVVLLSATLPAARRQRLLDAWSGDEAALDNVALDSAPCYPAITWRCGERGGVIGFDAPARTVALRWIPAEQHTALATDLGDALRDGGCAAVICNTVGRAQEMYRRLREALPDTDVMLFHARFLYEERMSLETAVLRRFGKPIDNPDRPHRAVVVATQVIEQSLDLDFDVMVTELAPVDLVIQRSGRLHRHNRLRPVPLSTPQLWLLAPPEDDGLPAFSRRDVFVYNEHVLLRSWLALRERTTVTTPSDLSPLIEAVYDESRPVPDDAPVGLSARWEATREELDSVRDAHEGKARQVAVYPPQHGERDFLAQRNQGLEEDNPEFHASLRAVTRLGDPSITAVCLTPEEINHLRPHSPNAGARAEALLQRSVSLNRPGLVQALVQSRNHHPVSWKRTALLRHCRLIELDELGTSEEIGGFRLRLDPELGVELSRSRPE
jgi:CRISPR-associated endonuclease/helicase Cas3